MSRRTRYFRWFGLCVALALTQGANSPHGVANPDGHRGDQRIGHKTSAWQRPAFAKHRAAAMKFGADYKKFLGHNKTEHEVVATALADARRRGFRDLLAAKRPAVRAGGKYFAQIQGKLAAFIVVGNKPLAEGTHVIASHVDSVRIDLKQNPLYSDANMALLQTHYYGGIKKYQWLSQPLEMRGVVITKAGKRVKVSIGDSPDEPVFIIPDVAAHVAHHVRRTQGARVPGESLDPILSSSATKKLTRGGPDPFAARAAELLESEHGLELADLAAAELELVPAFMPRDVGIDRAAIVGYGHDDRSCTYASLRALWEVGTPGHTAIVVLADKEEIGSVGNTGADSNFIRRVVAELLEGTGTASTSAVVDRVMASSIVFSADVTGAVNPQYKDVYEAGNAIYLGAGVVWDQSAVHSELMAYVRGLLDKQGITHQYARWTKSGAAAGGTVLDFFTRYGMSGLDVSIPVLSMHAPYEVISKADLYEAFRAYRAFLRD